MRVPRLRRLPKTEKEGTDESGFRPSAGHFPLSASSMGVCRAHLNEMHGLIYHAAGQRDKSPRHDRIGRALLAAATCQ